MHKCKSFNYVNQGGQHGKGWDVTVSRRLWDVIRNDHRHSIHHPLLDFSECVLLCVCVCVRGREKERERCVCEVT